MSAALLAEFLKQPHTGVIATLRRDGRPYTVPIWWLHDDGQFWITGTYSRVWCKQLMNDPRASLCIEAGAPQPGHVGVDGVVTLFELPDYDILLVSRRLAEKYVGRGDPANDEAVDRFFEEMQTEPRLLCRLDPAGWRAIGMRVYRGKRADREHQARVQTAAEG